MKKIIFTIAFFASINALNAQGFFTAEFEDDTREKDEKLDDVFKSYERSGSNLLAIFSNDAFKILLGDKERLNQKLHAFSLAQLSNPHLRLLRNMIYARYGYKFNSADLNQDERYQRERAGGRQIRGGRAQSEQSAEIRKQDE